VTEPPSRPRRRRRRARPEPPVGDGPESVAEYAPPATDDEAAEAEPGTAEPTRAARPAGRRGRGGKNREPADRGLRDLVANTPSQLGPVGAMRGRDVNRPTDDDLAEAERDVAIVRRHWTPPAT
jgi:hypothetical protein